MRMLTTLKPPMLCLLKIEGVSSSKLAWLGGGLFMASEDVEVVKWTHDAAVLVCRLVTHHSRLPQGAPTGSSSTHSERGPVELLFVSGSLPSPICYKRDCCLSAAG